MPVPSGGAARLASASAIATVWLLAGPAYAAGSSMPWEAPLQIVPGVPTLVLTGGWEPLYEEIAGYLRETGAVHRTAPGGHRPQDSAEGNRAIRAFIADVGRQQNLPFDFTELVPRQDHTRAFIAAAAACCALLLAYRAMLMRSWA